MMQPNQVISYLRNALKNADIFVDGASSLEYVKDNSRLMNENNIIVPTIFVVIGALTATTISFEAFEQIYEQRLTLITVVDNRQDRTGKYAQQTIFNLRELLFPLLLNYDGFDTDSHALQYVGDQMMDMDRARYWHKFEFKLNGRLLPIDGYQPNLTNLNEIINNWNSSDPLADNPLAVDDLKNLYD